MHPCAGSYRAAHAISLSLVAISCSCSQLVGCEHVCGPILRQPCQLALVRSHGYHINTSHYAQWLCEHKLWPYTPDVWDRIFSRLRADSQRTPVPRTSPELVEGAQHLLRHEHPAELATRAVWIVPSVLAQLLCLPSDAAGNTDTHASTHLCVQTISGKLTPCQRDGQSQIQISHHSLSCCKVSSDTSLLWAKDTRSCGVRGSLCHFPHGCFICPMVTSFDDTELSGLRHFRMEELLHATVVVASCNNEAHERYHLSSSIMANTVSIYGMYANGVYINSLFWVYFPDNFVSIITQF